MAAAGAAWAEHTNDGCECHGAELPDRVWLKQISRKADLVLLLFLTVLESDGLCVISSEGAMP